MKLIVGLGNPGKQYELTRHNAGFLAVDDFLKGKDVIACQSKFQAEICEYHEGGNKIFFVKPQTFMNLSGEAVKDIVRFYKVNPEIELLVVHDEKDFPFGTVKPAHNSSSAGHNGVQNIIDELGTQDFARVRIGVESREPGSPLPTDVFVLQKFSDDELAKLPTDVYPKVATLITEFIQK